MQAHNHLLENQDSLKKNYFDTKTTLIKARTFIIFNDIINKHEKESNIGFGTSRSD